LSNLMLDVLDKDLERRGHRFVRYADDCNIYVRSLRAGERVMASVSQFLEKKLKLKVNQGKSAVARPGERKFLGFSFTFGEVPKRRIASQSLKRFRLKVKELTRIGRSLNLSLLVERLRLYLTGWRSYFGFCETPSVLSKLDKWIRRRLRMVQWRQWKRGRTRFAELRKRDVNHDLAARTAGSAHGPWRLSRSPALSFSLPNSYFISLGLPTLAPGR
jgi:RNA-directed DNA polymerase